MTPSAYTGQSRWRDLLGWLRPMDNGPREIRAMDGLRALAALSVVVFHTLLAVRFYNTPLGHQLGNGWYYLATGVQLFFVLSGFLLFLPYARALLDERLLPSALRFYRRRALRIFPAYWVCLVILAILPTATHKTTAWLPDLAAHVGMIHDAFPVFNQDYEGPFWTLAVEWQFYMLLPLLAAGIAWVVRGRRGADAEAAHGAPLPTADRHDAARRVWRLAGGVLCVMALALALRGMDAAVMAAIPALPGAAGRLATVGVLATLGTQGKDLEVFAVGMLCAVLYVVTVEQQRISRRAMERLAYATLALAVLVFVVAVPRWESGTVKFTPGALWGADILGYPLLTGVGYGALALTALWGSRALRFPLELAPLRFIGLISYSLYLWHLPFIDHLLPGVGGWPIALRVVGAFVMAYLSYQLVERPFLKRRHREAPSGKPAVVTSVDGAVAVAREAR